MLLASAGGDGDRLRPLLHYILDDRVSDGEVERAWEGDVALWRVVRERSESWLVIEGLVIEDLIMRSAAGVNFVVEKYRVLLGTDRVL